MANAINIFVEKQTARHFYVFKLVFDELLGIPFSVTQDNTAKNVQINYSTNSEIGGIQILPSGLLEEENISVLWQEKIRIEPWNGLTIFFGNATTPIPFDIFSAIFYCVSRYEEFLPFTPDAHNRFSASSSFLLKHSLLQKPIVNQWVIALQQELVLHYPELVFSPRKFQFLSTIDIDQAWKFRYKGLLRNVIGTFRDLLSQKWENLFNRWPVLLGSKLDPFYNFDWQKQIHGKFSIAVKYFILLGDLSKYDKNIVHSNPKFRELINALKQLPKTEVGIHPSYKSNTNASIVESEIKRLKDIISQEVILSRQHFLMHQMPATYQNLIANGIQEEHTMGYSTHLGFRAGIAAPFYFFDLSKNEETSLQLFPFCAMDITPLHYMHKTPDEAMLTLSQLMDEVKKVGGLFISLWHNESFSETERWLGWRKVYEHLLTEGSETK